MADVKKSGNNGAIFSPVPSPLAAEGLLSELHQTHPHLLMFKELQNHVSDILEIQSLFMEPLSSSRGGFVALKNIEDDNVIPNSQEPVHE